ncbi:MAG: alanine dehydrogenase [Deltaproteobacteria bacterium]|nr:alanine dehydrogenase [Deltaproteobacteria bacterium]
MIIGVPKEIKVKEFRVGMVPAGVKQFVEAGHKVFVQKGAGEGSGISDEQYIAAGAKILDTAKEVWEKADMIVKVKEPQESEYKFFREGLVIYTYFHLAAEPTLTKALLKAKITAIAYETIELEDHSLPLLRPMSEIAGRMSIQVGALSLQKEHEGKGVLLGGVPGVKKAKVTIIGGGTVGTNAAKMAIGLGADVTILDIDLQRLVYLDDIFGSRVQTLYSNPTNIEESVLTSDLVIGAVLVPGARAPILVPESMVKKMSEGSVIVDVAVDQGGCIETVKPTTHENPTFKKHGVVHYCVANMPGAVARTSTFALTNATTSWGLILANLGVEKAIKRYKPLELGVNCYKGALVYKAVADSLGLEYTPLKDVM